MKGLIIQQPWIGMILSGEKSWEMRPRGWSHRGPLALIEKGSGKVMGIATVTDCLLPLTQAEMRQFYTKHRIPESIYNRADFRWFTPLVLTDVQRLSPPVPYKHKNGAQNPVNLDPDAERDVLRQAGRGRPQSDHRREELEARSSAPRSTSTASLPSGECERLVVDIIVKDGGKAHDRAKRFGWMELVGVYAGLLAAFCQLAFVVHFALGLSSSSISALAAFKWLIPMMVGVFIAGLCGQGDLLSDFSGNASIKPVRRRR